MANKKKSGKKSKGFLSKLIFIVSLALLGGSAYLGFRIWQVYQPIVALDSGSYTDFFIYPDTQADKVIADLINSGIITNESALQWVAKQKGYEGEVKSGKYLIYDQWNANQLINTLRAGNQNPIKFIRGIVMDLEFPLTLGRVLNHYLRTQSLGKLSLQTGNIGIFFLPSQFFPF